MNALALKLGLSEGRTTPGKKLGASQTQKKRGKKNSKKEKFHV